MIVAKIGQLTFASSPLSHRRRFATWRSRILARQTGCASLEAQRLSPAEAAHSRARRLGAHSSLPDATAVRHEDGTAIPLALLFRSAARNRLRQPAPFQVPSRRSSARRLDHDRRGRAQGRRPLRHPSRVVHRRDAVRDGQSRRARRTHAREAGGNSLRPNLYTKEAVCFHLAALIARRLRRERMLATTRIASWDARFKGIDDAAVRNLPITSISVQRWLDLLSPRFRQIAMARLSEIAGFPSEQSCGGRQKPPP